MTDSIINNDSDFDKSIVSTDSIINIHKYDNRGKFHSDEVQKVTVTKLKSNKRNWCLIICFLIILVILLTLGLASFIQIRNFKNRFRSTDKKRINVLSNQMKENEINSSNSTPLLVDGCDGRKYVEI